MTQILWRRTGTMIIFNGPRQIYIQMCYTHLTLSLVANYTYSRLLLHNLISFYFLFTCCFAVIILKFFFLFSLWITIFFACNNFIRNFFFCLFVQNQVENGWVCYVSFIKIISNQLNCLLILMGKRYQVFLFSVFFCN